jgi:hypothetical protein
MQRKLIIALVFAVFALLPAKAQLLKKLKEKVNQATDQIIPGNNNSTSNSGSTSGNSSGKPQNKTGAGLISTPPDIESNLASSETAFKANKYSESRYALQQAILGVELRIGQEILKLMPDEVNGVPKIPEKDKVASSGWGWNGLMINRDYQKGDKYLGVAIQDFSYLGPMWGMYFNGGMTQQENNEQKMKNIMVKGNKGVISYDANKGYTVVVMLTQGSALTWEGVNYAGEQEMMDAVNKFDIDKIKGLLGEK